MDSDGSLYNYVVSASPPSAIERAIKANFTSSEATNLLLAYVFPETRPNEDQLTKFIDQVSPTTCRKGSRLEIHTLTPDGLEGVIDVPIYGRISGLKKFRPQGFTKDLVFLLTEHYEFCLLEYEDGTLQTRAAGVVSDRIGRPCEMGQVTLVDPQCKFISLQLYDGVIKIIPIDDNGQLQEAFNLRISELRILDEVMLYGAAASTLAVLYEDNKGQRYVKTYSIGSSDFELTEGTWTRAVDPASTLLIPVRQSPGVIVVGESSITYVAQDASCSTSIRPTLVRAYGEVDEDGSRFLLGDHIGNFYLLILQRNAQGKVEQLHLELLGRTSQASTITYLDTGVVFVGSSFGDSQLIKLHSNPPDPDQPTNYIELLDTVTNLGPITDFCVMDLDRQGQGQVVTCSGTGVDGSLRIVRNGIGVIEQAAIELPGIKGVWSLRATYMDVYDTYLILTFVGETRLLGLNQEEELDEADIPGFEVDAQTVFCGNVTHDQFLQVTKNSVRLIDCGTKQMVAEWHPPDGCNINSAAASPSQVALALGGGHLVYLEVEDGAIAEKLHKELEAEVSSLDITPLEPESERADFIAVGLWSVSVAVFALPDLQLIALESLGGEIIPRSVMFANFEGVSYLFCGLGDGHLVNYRLEGAGLVDRKKLALGTKPITLRTFVSRNSVNIFAASDRPTIIYSSNRKLVYSNLNENEVNFMASFNTPGFPDSIAIAKEESLIIGTTDEIQKLHIRTVAMHEHLRRIAHQPSSRSLAVACTHTTFAANSDNPARDALRLLDEQTFETLARFELEENELVCSLCSGRLGENKSVHYYVLGTALIVPEEAEPNAGRLLVFEVRDSQLCLVSATKTRGAVYNVRCFQERLLTGINNRVILYEMVQKDDQYSLEPECSHAGHVLALFIDTFGDLIILGDLMKSIQLLVYNSEEKTLELRARDTNPVFLNAVSVLDEDTYIGAEGNYNLFVVRRSKELTDEKRSRLEVVGEFHLGEFVNRFQRGSLVMKLPDSELTQIPTLLFVTINGVIGVIASLPKDLYEFLSKLQDAMRHTVKGVGGFDHAKWRAFQTPGKQFQSSLSGKSRNFIDGDLIEQFLDLKRESMEAVVGRMGGGVTLEEVTRNVEELSRLH